MHVLIRTNKLGETVAVYPVPSDAHPIFLTVSAQTELMRRLTEANGRCSECGIFARSGELIEGKCSPAVGCGIDSILNPVRNTQDQVQKHLAMTTHISAFIKKYIRKVYLEVGPGEPEDTAPPEGGTNPLGGW